MLKVNIYTKLPLKVLLLPISCKHSLLLSDFLQSWSRLLLPSYIFSYPHELKWYIVGFLFYFFYNSFFLLYFPMGVHCYFYNLWFSKWGIYNDILKGNEALSFLKILADFLKYSNQIFLCIIMSHQLGVPSFLKDSLCPLHFYLYKNV